jgi:hypothetical protein
MLFVEGRKTRMENWIECFRQPLQLIVSLGSDFPPLIESDALPVAPLTLTTQLDGNPMPR